MELCRGRSAHPDFPTFEPHLEVSSQREGSKALPNPDLILKREMESLLCGASIRRLRLHASSLPGRTALKDFAASTDIAAACDLLNLPLRALSIIHVDACACCQSTGWGFLLKHPHGLLDAANRG